MNAKRIEAANLMWAVTTNVSDNEAKMEMRKRCYLLRLLLSTDADELRSCLDQLFMDLASDAVFPPPEDDVERTVYERTDVTNVTRTMTAVRNGSNPTHMKALILFGLRVSRRFRQFFCPPPSAGLRQRFLVNPVKFEVFLSGPANPLCRFVTHFITSSLDYDHMITHFVAMCLSEWMEYEPWADFEKWGSASPNQPAIEIAHVRKRLRQATNAGVVDDDTRYLEDTAAADAALLEL
jgi:hypothetical protein